MFYTTIRGLLRFIFYFLGLKAEGLENIPKSGPIIIAANHVSNWDPVVVALVISRPVYFMVKAALFKYKIMDKVVRALHAFPVKRGGSGSQRHTSGPASSRGRQGAGYFSRGSSQHNGRYGKLFQVWP